MADSDKSLYTLRYNQITSNLEAFGGGTPQWTLVTLNNVDPQQVPITREINTTAPLYGGGNLTVDRTLYISQANNTTDGYLSSMDWNTFNNKLTSVLNSANIFVGNAFNFAAAVPVSGDMTLVNSGIMTLNTVNGNVGTFMNAQITVNAKGLITAASSGTIGNLTDVGTDGITITGGIGAVLGTGASISQHVADSTHNGYLSSTDWTRFDTTNLHAITALTGDATATGPGGVALTLATVNANVGSFTNAAITVNAKGLITAASSGTTGNLTDAGTDGITITNGTGAVLGTGTSISQHVADSTHNGYLSSTDWSTFNGKQAAGNYITALTGDVTASGPGSVAATLATVNANVGSFTHASITVNAKGLITAASSGTAPVTSVSGTTNQITSTGGTTPVLAIANPLTLPGAMTAGGAIAMSSNKITGLANGTASTDAAAFGQIYVGFQALVVGTSTTGTTTTSSTYQNSNLSATITPTSSVHRIKITVMMVGGISSSASTTTANYSLSRNGTNVSANGATGTLNRILSNTTGGVRSTVSFIFIDSPASTSALTYTVIYNSSDNTGTVIAGSTSDQVITLEEIV